MKTFLLTASILLFCLFASFESKANDSSTFAKVEICDEAGLLSTTDRRQLSTLQLEGRAVYIIHLIDSVNPLSANSFANELLDRYQAAYDSTDASTIVISFINNLRLLQVRASDAAGEYASNIHPAELFQFQQTAADSLTTATIADVARFIDNGVLQYQSMSWPSRLIHNLGGLEDYLCDGLILNFILPSDSLLYRYLYSWLLYIPKAIAFGLFRVAGSVVGTVLLIMLICSLLWLGYCKLRIARTKPSASRTRLKLSLQLLCNLTLSAFIPLIVLVTPDMTNIVVLASDSYSATFLSHLADVYCNATESSWALRILLTVGIFGVAAIDADKIVFATLNWQLQRRFFAKQLPAIKADYGFPMQFFWNKIVGEAKQLSHPYRRLCSGRAQIAIGEALIALVVSLFINEQILIVISAFLWTKIAIGCISVATAVNQMKQLGVYNTASQGFRRFLNSI